LTHRNTLIPVGVGPLDIAFAPSNNNLYVTNIGNSDSDGFSPSVSVISTSTNTVANTIPLPTNFYPTGIVFATSNNDIYVAGSLPNRTSSPSSESYAVYAISTSSNTIVATIPLGYGPNFGGYLLVVFAPSNNNIYVTNGNTGTISVISTTTNILLATIPVPADRLSGLAFAPSNNEIYLAGGSTNTVFVIDTFTNTVVGTLPVGFAYSVAFSSSNNNIYVANLDHSISVISTSTNTLITTIQVPAGYEISGVAFSPSNNEIYATGDGNSFPTIPPGGLLSTVFVICASTNSQIGSISLPNGSDPAGVAFASSNNEIYVVNANSNTVAAIATIHQHPVPASCAAGNRS